MLSKFYTLKCIRCGTTFDEKDTVTSCLKCQAPLDVIYDYERIKRRLNNFALENTPISATKYLDFYPILDLEKIITLKEGGTPLYKADNLGKKLKLKNVYIKNEGANPTGVFKDRGTLVEITKALELNAKAVCLASSGNMAASCAAYAAVASIPCYVLVPDGTPIGKLSQALTYGAKVIKIRDVYSTCAKLAVQMAKKNNFYLAGDYVFRREGQKSQSYEIIEQLRWQSPDYLIAPIGCGTNLSAIWKGFVEFYKLGLINKLPKLIGVQPTGCDTIAKAIKNKTTIKPLEKINTICSAVAVNNPLDGEIVLKAIRDSKGTAITVTDDEALEGEQILGREESIFVEPSAALAVAALQKLAKDHFFNKEDKIVVLASGNGLKDPITALKNLPEPPTLEADINQINHYLALKLYNLRGTLNRTKEERIWRSLPQKAELKTIVKKEFDINITPELIEEIYQQSKNFSEKTNKMRRADLQLIIENALQELAIGKPVLKIVDFDLKVSKHKKPVAKVELIFKGQKITAEAEGVGPVDAIIKAIRKGLEGKDPLGCWLTDYFVSIDTKGTDAAVEVKIKIKDNKDHEVIGSATSPDIIVASIDAFVKGYNTLWVKSQ